MTHRGVFKRQSGSRPPDREPSSSPSDVPAIDEGPRRRLASSTPPRYELPDFPRPSVALSIIKRMVMKTPSFNGKCSVISFLTKFDNCGEYNVRMEGEKFYYLINALEDPAELVL